MPHPNLKTKVSLSLEDCKCLLSTQRPWQTVLLSCWSWWQVMT